MRDAMKPDRDQVLQRIAEAAAMTERQFTPEEIRTAAQALGREDFLPDPVQELPLAKAG